MPDDIKQQEPATPVVEYSPTAAGLAELRSRLANVVYDVATPAGMEIARKDRRECVQLRVHLEEIRQREKAPLLERGRLLDAEAKRITAEILAIEEPIDVSIKQREAEVDAERERKRQIELARIKNIRDRIEAIRRAPLLCLGMASDEIAVRVSNLQAQEIGPDGFAEFTDDAIAARSEALEALGRAYDAATASEAAAANLAEQQAELARQREAHALAERAAKEKRAAEEAAARAERERQDAIARQEREEADRRSRESRAAEDRERLRVAGIRTMIDGIAEIATDLTGAQAQPLRDAIADVEQMVIEPSEFAEFVDAARESKEAVLARLKRMLALQEAADAESERIRLEREDLERRQREQREADEARDAAAAAAAQAQREREQQEEAERRSAAETARIAELATDPSAALNEIIAICDEQRGSGGYVGSFSALARIRSIAKAMLDVFVPTLDDGK